jgi:hypothetical protein
MGFGKDTDMKHPRGFPTFFAGFSLQEGGGGWRKTFKVPPKP